MSDLREVNQQFPFNETAEARILLGEAHPLGAFPPRDPERLRGIRSRPLAALCWALWKRLNADEKSGEASRRRERWRRDQELEEMRSLRMLANDALGGKLGKEAKAVATKLLVNDEGKKLLDDKMRLLETREALAQLRAERAKQGRLPIGD